MWRYIPRDTTWRFGLIVRLCQVGQFDLISKLLTLAIIRVWNLIPSFRTSCACGEVSRASVPNSLATREYIYILVFRIITSKLLSIVNVCEIYSKIWMCQIFILLAHTWTNVLRISPWKYPNIYDPRYLFLIRYWIIMSYYNKQ